MYMQPDNESESEYELGARDNIDQLLQTLQSLINWAGAQMHKWPRYEGLDSSLLLPYYRELLTMMCHANARLLLPGRVEYMAENVASSGRAAGIRKPLERWRYRDVLRSIEREIERVEGMEREDNLHRLDHVTRCLYVAIVDKAVVPSWEEATRLRVVIHRMREMGDPVSSEVPMKIFVLRALDGGTRDAEEIHGKQETQEALTDDPLNSEELHEFTTVLFDMQLWAMKHAKLVSDTAVEYKLIMPYYWRLLSLMKKGDPTKLLPDRLWSWSKATRDTARELGINKWETEWTYDDQLLVMEAEFKEVDSREWEDNFYRVDFMTYGAPVCQDHLGVKLR